jgi:hypothetical protein
MMILNQRDADVVFCSPGHHDHAHEWATRRRLGVPETAGVAHFVPIDERVDEGEDRVRGVEQDRGSPPPPPFGRGDDASLLRTAVPRPFLDAVRAASLDTLPRSSAQNMLLRTAPVRTRWRAGSRELACHQASGCRHSICSCCADTK